MTSRSPSSSGRSFFGALRLHRTVPGALVLLMLVAAGEDGKKGCSCKKDPIDTDVEPDTEVFVAEVEVALQVVSVNPARVTAGEATDATVFGAGFEAGAVVNVGAAAASNVRTQSDSTITMTVPPLTAGRYDVEVRLPSGEIATLRRGLSAVDAVPQCETLTVLFGYNRDELAPEAIAAVDANVACYTGRSDGIRIEGHADERGTTDYNIALGDRRADAVKRYLAGKGVAASRVRTVSFGEERPVNPGHDEAAWRENRRAVIHVGQ